MKLLEIFGLYTKKEVMEIGNDCYNQAIAEFSEVITSDYNDTKIGFTAVITGSENEEE